jgi:hypothetical protein
MGRVSGTENERVIIEMKSAALEEAAIGAACILVSNMGLRDRIPNMSKHEKAKH